MLEEKDLATGDLSRFDTIVVGIRASQVRVLISSPTTTACSISCAPAER
jgi:hypothetical protein